MKNGKWTIIIALIAIVGGIIMFQQYQRHQEEFKRNREYEVSLVNTLKNTYAGIEEIKLVEPEYRTKPTSWVTKIEICFQDGTEIKYRLSYELQTKIIRSNTIKKEYMKEERLYLESHQGKTFSTVKVIFSNGEEGEQ